MFIKKQLDISHDAAFTCNSVCVRYCDYNSYCKEYNDITHALHFRVFMPYIRESDNDIDLKENNIPGPGHLI